MYLKKLFQGPYTREDGFLGYNEICEELQNEENPWEVNWDEKRQVPYMVKGTKWISFDNEKSIRDKTWMAASEGLAGVMTWSVHFSGFNLKIRAFVNYS